MRIKRFLLALLLGLGMTLALLTVFTIDPAQANENPCPPHALADDACATDRDVANSVPISGEQPASQTGDGALLLPDADPSTKQPRVSLEQAYQRVLDAGTYDFTADAEQTLLPRPLPNMIGQTDQRVDMHIEGEVTLPDKTQFSLSLDGAGLDPTPVTMVQEGTDTYLLREGEKIPVENPAGLTSPTGDYLSYLAAAENVQPCESDAAPFAEAVACYTYDINGQRFAEHVRDQMQAEVNNSIAPPNIQQTVSLSPILMKMSGQGKVWLDIYGLPLRQSVDMAIPEVDEYYDSQVRMVIDYQFSESAVQSVLAVQEAKASFLPPIEVVINDVQESLPNMIVIFLVLVILILLITLRHRRWMYRLIAWSISFVLLATPLLQIIGYSRYGNQVQAAGSVESLVETLIVPEAETAALTFPESESLATAQITSAAQAYEPNTYCGKGGNGDRDGDGLADDAEYCFGTNPNLADSDYDGINDDVELAGFQYGYGQVVTQTWYSNPMNADSNGDGVNDGLEWASSHKGQADNWDLDKDGTPNLWDFDDDGDGVSDKNDLSPASRTAYITPTVAIKSPSNNLTLNIGDTFNFNITGKHDGYIYVEMQVQPLNKDHLRYSITPLDWGFDNKAQIQDQNDSTDDITLIPMLSIETNLPPDNDLAQQYNVTSFKDTDNDGYSQILLPLGLIGEGGRAEAFGARMAYGPDTLAALGSSGIRWQDARIIWIVRGKIDSSNTDGTVSEKTMSIHVYVEPSFRITGWQVTKSGEYRTAVLGTPDFPDDDRYLFQLIFGLSSSYLTHQQPDLDDINARFSGANTSIEEKWGITTTVKMDVSSPYAHFDAGLADINNRIKTFLTDNYAWDTPNTVLIASESHLGLYGQDDLKKLEPDINSLSVNLNNITLMTQHSLNLNMRDGWDALPGNKLAAEVINRTKTAVDAALVDLKDQYPDLTAAELLALTQSMYTTWEIGRTRTLNIDGLNTEAPSVTDQEIYKQIFTEPRDRHNDPENISTLPGYLVEAGHFAQKGGGLVFKAGSGGAWQYMQSNALEAGIMGFTPSTVTFFDKANQALVSGMNGAPTFAETDLAELGQTVGDTFLDDDIFKDSKAYLTNSLATTDAVRTVVDAAKGWSKTAEAAVKTGASVSKIGKVASIAGKVSTVVGVIGVALDIGIALYGFINSWVNDGFSLQALANLIAAIIVAVALFIISTIPPWIGAVIVAVLGILDLVLMLCEACQDFLGIDSISGWVTENIAGYFYQEEPLSEIGDFKFGELDTRLVDQNMGYIVGNRFRISNSFEGIIQIPQPEGFKFTIADGVAAAYTGGLSVIAKLDLLGAIIGKPDNDEVLEDSWICGEYEVKNWNDFSVYTTCPYSGVDYKLDTIPTNAQFWTYNNPMTITLTLNKSGSNIAIPLQTKITAQTVKDVSIPVPPISPLTFAMGRIHWTETDKFYLPSDLPKKNQWKPDNIYLDVLPATVEELWNWDDSILTNHDPDGDGMSTKAEINAQLGSSAYLDFLKFFKTYLYDDSEAGLDRFLAFWDENEDNGSAEITSFCSAYPTWSSLCSSADSPFWLTWDSDGDGLSDKFEFDNNGSLGTDFSKKDTDGDGISDGFEYRLGTRIDKKDSDGDGLPDNVEVYHPTSDGTWSGGWDIELPKYGAVGPSGRFTITVPVFSNPLVADTDGDGMSDLAEKGNGTSPTAFNRAPRVTLTGQPTAVSPWGVKAVYVKPGDRITLTSNLEVYPPYTVSSTMSLNLPGSVFGYPTTPALSGSRGVPNTGVTWTPRWDFSNNVLQPWEYLYAATTSYVSYVSSSVVTTATLELPFGSENQKQEASQLFVVDTENPSFGLLTPVNGDLIGGGVSNYVMGGYSSDPTTWVDHIDINLPSAGTETITRSQSLSPWAYTWSLPADGIYTLSANATDFVGNVSSTDSVQVMVDNTPPTVTVNLADNAVYGPPQDSDVITITLNGTATENYSGLTRVQISTDGGPWREVWTLETSTVTNTTFTDFTTNFTNRATAATWDAVWTLPNVETVQGYHSLRIRGFDQAGNWPMFLERTIIVDVIPPTAELVNRAYLYEFPHVPANAAHTFNGVANDVGNVPQPSRPAELIGSLDSMDDATIWLGLSTIGENDGGINVAWIGDFNGDRRGDLLVGLPASAAGAGKVAVVYGRSGNWPIPNEQEMLDDAFTSFIGVPGAGIGANAIAAGDVNGDGLADLLIGDLANNRVFLIFGQNRYFGYDILLDGPQGATRTVLTVPDGELIGDYLGAAGDVNGDGFADVLIGANGTADKAYLLLGQSGTWWEKMPLDSFAAAVIYGAGSATLTGVGDLDGDFHDEFAAGINNTLYLFEGKGSFAPQAGAYLNVSGYTVDTFASVDANPQAVPLGDVNGDHKDDFIYTNDNNQHLVYGDDNLGDGSWTTFSFSYGAGFLSAPGDVDRDGLNDILIGGSGDNAYLVLGSSIGSAQATISGVLAAASAPYPAGADLNSDGSSDLLLIPTAAGGQATVGASSDGIATLPSAWVPQLQEQTLPTFVGDTTWPAVDYADAYVNGDGVCYSLTPCYTTIQAAVNAWNDDDLIIVQPGAYAPFFIDGDIHSYNRITIRGTDPDAVFVDAGGSSYAARIRNATGVRLENMTLRNASYGVQLDDAGLNGHEVLANRTILDHLLIYDTSGHNVYMSRSSSVSVTHSTLAQSSQHIGTFGPADPNVVVQWNAMDNTPWGTYDGGGAVAIGDKIYVETGGGGAAFGRYDATSDQWISAPWGPNNSYDPDSAIAAGSDEQVYLLGAPIWKDAQVGGWWTDFAEGGNGAMYAVDSSNAAHVWNGIGWSAISGSPSCTTIAAHPVNGDLYCHAYLEDALYTWDGNSWTNLGAMTFYFSNVHDMAVDSDGNVHVVGDLSFSGSFGNCYHYAKWSGVSWSCSGDFTSSDIVDVIAIAPGSNLVYVGGEFDTGYGVNITSMNGGWIEGVTDVVNGIDVDDDGTVYVSGEFTSTLDSGTVDQATPAGIASWNGSSWTSYPVVIDGDPWNHTYPYDIAATDGGEFYSVGLWEDPFGAGGKTNFIRWTGTAWEKLGTSYNASNNSNITEIVANERGVFIQGDFTAIERPGESSFSTQYAAALQFPHEVYSPTLNLWSSNLIGAPMSLQDGASYAGDANGNIILLVGGGRTDSFKYDIDTGTWSRVGDMPDPVNASAMTVGKNGDIYAVTDGSSSLYRFNGSWWVAEGPQITAATIADGVALAYDPHLENYYVLPGGNSINMLRYNSSVGNWETLPADRNTPAGVRPGAALVLVEGPDGNKLYTPQGNYTGDTSRAFWMYPLPQPNKVGFEHTAIYAQTASSWLNLSDPMPEDFNFRIGAGTLFFGGSGWTPTNKGTLPETSADPFLDTSRDLYRMGQTGYTVGYHTYTDPVTATTTAGIQAAINSGANRVVVEPGIYEEAVYLVNGVEVIGANPDWTIIRPLSGSTANALVRAEGPVGASLSRFTLDGQNSGLNGLEVSGNAAHITLQRAPIYGTNTGIVIDGADSDLEVTHVTAARNNNGLSATNCASVDVRDSIFAYHTGSGLSHEACAAVKLHTYNLYWANASDFGAAADAGAAELFLDPNFVDPMDNDYRTFNFSPVIDAGNPTDPAPPGAGSRADIGYVEQGRINFYVDDNYCDICINDGLTWQVDAFDNIQSALNAARDALANLNPSQAYVPQLVVGVAPGAYNEQVMVPSHVLLMGSGAEVTVIDGGGGTAVSLDGVTQSGVRDLTLTNATTAIRITNASNNIVIQRNIFLGNTVGTLLDGRGTAEFQFNTFINNSAGVSANGPGAWAALMNNIISGSDTGLTAVNSGQIFSDYNLLNNTTDFSGAEAGASDLTGQDPQFDGGANPYRLTATSPALDAASPQAFIPNGGGTRPDMGYSELLAAPITLLLGKEDLSTVMGNSGVGSVEYSVVQIADSGQPVTATLPGAWSPITLDTPGETVSYWATNYTPIDEGLYRFYSRATDMVGNQEEDEIDWYDGSFVADSTPPTVAWLSPANGASLDGPLEFRAQASDYAAGEFSIEEKDVHFEIDGTTYPATWASEPWDEESGDPRIFRAWVTPTVGVHNNVIAYAEDKANNNTSNNGLSFTINSIAAPDTTPPGVTVTLPVNGSWLTRTVFFSGTVADVGSGVAAVEISIDGGATWRPASVSGSDWTLTWEGPADQSFVSYPAQVRATDHAGNVAGSSFQFTVDELPPAGLAPVTFSAAEGTHFDVATTLVLTWNVPIDGSGIVTTVLTMDQITNTTPADIIAGTTGSHLLDSNGEWYAHLAAVDAAGNVTMKHYGPWYVGIDEGVAFGSRQQSIIIDGFLDTDNGEWQLDSEFLDSDERTIGSAVTYSPQGAQSFLTTWDANNYYMAWRGGWWTLDGELWIYLNTGGGGGNQLITPLALAPAATLPFDANYAVQITAPLTGTLWEYAGGWQVSTEEWSFAQGSGGDTEIQLPLFGTSNIEVLAFGLGDDRNVWAIFPATNPLNPGNDAPPAPLNLPNTAGLAGTSANLDSLSKPSAVSSGGWTSYHWDDITVVNDVAAGQPQAMGLELTIDSLQSPQMMWGPGNTLQYVVQLTNRENFTLTGRQIAFIAIPFDGLVHDDIQGATCMTTNPWLCTMDPLPPGTSVITLTTHLASDLSGIAEVTMYTALQDINIPSEFATQGVITHKTDSEPPIVEVTDLPFVYLGSQIFQGTADDGPGVGVDFVEVRPDGGSWQRVEGTEFWSADLTVSPFLTHGDVWRFEVRATDLYGQVGAPQEITFTVDLQAPAISLDAPAALNGEFNEIMGSVTDSPSGSMASQVTVKLDGESWREALLFAPNEAGEQPFLWTWNMPTEDGVTHTLQVQAVDLVGNISGNAPQEVWVDNVVPTLTVTQVFTQVIVQDYRPDVGTGAPILTGTVSDGGGVAAVDVFVELPNGQGYHEWADLVGETWSYTPVLELVGDYRLRAEGQDSLGNATQSVFYELNVIAAPDTGSNQFITAEDTPITFEPLFNDLDLDGDVLSVDAVGNPSHGSAIISPTTWIVYTPTLNFNGTDVFTYTASDGVLTDTATITVTVTPVNDPPVISGSGTVSRIMGEDGGTIVINSHSDDVDGDVLAWTIEPGVGTAVISSTSGAGNSDAVIAFTPPVDYNGLDTFTVQVSDGALTDTITVKVTVTAVDDAPRAADDFVVMVAGDVGVPITLDLLSNDIEVDGQGMSLAAIGIPSLSGSAHINGSMAVYTPSLAIGETETITYTVSDGGLVDTAVISATMVAGDASGGNDAVMIMPDSGISDTITITITIPPDAAGDNQFTLIYGESTFSGSPPREYAFAGLSFTLDAYVNGVLTTPYTFTAPITLTLEYGDNDVAHIIRDDQDLELRYWDGDAWLLDGITIVERDTVNNRLVVSIEHFTEFALFGWDGYRVYLPVTISGTP